MFVERRIGFGRGDLRRGVAHPSSSWLRGQRGAQPRSLVMADARGMGLPQPMHHSIKAMCCVWSTRRCGIGVSPAAAAAMTVLARSCRQYCLARCPTAWPCRGWLQITASRRLAASGKHAEWVVPPLRLPKCQVQAARPALTRGLATCAAWTRAPVLPLNLAMPCPFLAGPDSLDGRSVTAESSKEGGKFSSRWE